ncbi:hypothetical protein, partial [Shewanella sp.]|uniref:hypothetical protein n=1 Tax=Shewanella sp. TaxID=50422 RepID=UPI003D09B13A
TSTASVSSICGSWALSDSLLIVTPAKNALFLHALGILWGSNLRFQALGSVYLSDLIFVQSKRVLLKARTVSHRYAM